MNNNNDMKLTAPVMIQTLIIFCCGGFALVVFPMMLMMSCIDECFGPSLERDRVRAEEQERYEAEVFAEYGETLEDRRARWKQLGDEAEWRRLQKAAVIERLIDDPTYLNDE